MAGRCTYCEKWARPAVVARWQETGSGPGYAALAHEDCLAKHRRPTLPRRVRGQAVREAIEEGAAYPEARAAVLAVLPDVPVWGPEQVRAGLRRVADRLARVAGAVAR